MMRDESGMDLDWFSREWIYTTLVSISQSISRDSVPTAGPMSTSGIRNDVVPAEIR